MGMVWRQPREEPTLPQGTGQRLSEMDRAQLEMLEGRVDAGIEAIDRMIEAGKALAVIRQRQLYRAASATWEGYVSTRFNLTKRRADQLIGFAEVQGVLDEMGTAVPKMSERSIRPLVGLDPEAVREVVSEASEDPAGVTPATLRKAAAKRKPKAKAKAPRPRRFKVPGGIVVVTLNAKAAAAGIDIEAALLAAVEAVRRDGQAEAA
jgi:hypothetical protein